VERALEEVIAERDRNRRAWAAQEKLLQSGIEIDDVYQALDRTSAAGGSPTTL
jgi:hypothetical protein